MAKSNDSLYSDTDEWKHYFDFFPLGIATVDPSGKFLSMNDWGCKQLKLRRNRIGKTTVNDVFPNILSLDNAPLIEENLFLNVILRTLQPVEKQLITFQIKGDTFVYLVRAVPVIQRGKLTRIVMTFRDTTREQKQERMQHMFIKLIGHELKQPLGSIRAYTYYLKRYFRQHGSPGNDYATKIDEQVELISQMLNDIVDATSFSLNTFRIHRRKSNVISLVSETLKELRMTHPNRFIVFTNATEKESLTVSVDRLRVRQMIVNLVSNAFKYSPPDGKVIVTTAIQDKYFTISVQDFGSGIAPEDLKTVFQPYFRAQKDKGRVPGLGLGLALVRYSIKRHHGHVTVESAPGDGTRFTLFFPLPRT